jgi:hypothetical protein
MLRVFSRTTITGPIISTHQADGAICVCAHPFISTGTPAREQSSQEQCTPEDDDPLKLPGIIFSGNGRLLSPGNRPELMPVGHLLK